MQLAQLARTAHMCSTGGECIWPYQSVLPPSEMSLWRVVTRVGNWFRPPGLNHGLNRLKLNEFMPLAGIDSILPGLNRFKPVKTTGWQKSILATGWHKYNFSRLFSNPGRNIRELSVMCMLMQLSRGMHSPNGMLAHAHAVRCPPSGTKCGPIVSL